MNPPLWLPALLVLDGVWEQNLHKLFVIFKADFIDQQPEVDGVPVWHDREIREGVYPEGFWHVITRKDRIRNERFPDFRRAERLPWCGPSINNSNDPIIQKWDVIEKKEYKTYIWLVSYDYVIVLVRRKKRFGYVKYIETAYHVDGDSTKRSLNTRYANRVR